MPERSSCAKPPRLAPQRSPPARHELDYCSTTPSLPMRSHRTDGEIEGLPVTAGHSPDHSSPPTVDGYTYPAAAAGDVFRVAGMDCSEEVAAIERALKPLPGVIGVRAEIVASKVTVFHDGKLSRSLSPKPSTRAVSPSRTRGSAPAVPPQTRSLLPPLVSLLDLACCCNGLVSRKVGSLTSLFLRPS